MSELVKILCDASALHHRYRRAHRLAFGISMRSLLPRPLGGTDARETLVLELSNLICELDATSTELGTLPAGGLEVRRGAEIRTTLSELLAALAESSARLKAYCERESSGDAAPMHGDPLRIACDDAVQYHRSVGAKLNKLIEHL